MIPDVVCTCCHGLGVMPEWKLFAVGTRDGGCGFTATLAVSCPRRQCAMDAVM